MDNKEISRLLRRHQETRSTFVDVCAADTLPPHARERKPCAYVVNTDVVSGGGKHWVGFHFSSNDVPDDYDSFAFLPSSVPNFIDFLGTEQNYRHNTQFIQSPITAVCGQHVMYYISKKCRGCTLKEIVSDFDRNRLEENDKAVNDYVEKTFGTDQNVYDMNFLYSHIAKSLQELLSIKKNAF